MTDSNSFNKPHMSRLLAAGKPSAQGAYRLAQSLARLAQVTSSLMGIYFRDPGPEWSEFVRLWKAAG